MVIFFGCQFLSKTAKIYIRRSTASELVFQFAIFDDNQLKKILGGSPIRLDRFRSLKRSKNNKITTIRIQVEIIH